MADTSDLLLELSAACGEAAEFAAAAAAGKPCVLTARVRVGLQAGRDYLSEVAPQSDSLELRLFEVLLARGVDGLGPVIRAELTVLVGLLRSQAMSCARWARFVGANRDALASDETTS